MWESFGFCRKAVARRACQGSFGKETEKKAYYSTHKYMVAGSTEQSRLDDAHYVEEKKLEKRIVGPCEGSDCRAANGRREGATRNCSCPG